jgi:hypothetical protein
MSGKWKTQVWMRFVDSCHRYRTKGGPFSSKHVSRWNYTIPRMRYDVFEHNIVTNVFTESNNLFAFDLKMLYTWNDTACHAIAHNTIEYECIPPKYRIKEYVLCVSGLLFTNHQINKCNVDRWPKVSIVG